MIKLIVGLGNPGEKYKMTRHNLGFRVIDKISENFNFPAMKCETKFKAEISECKINPVCPACRTGRRTGRNEKILFVKPQTFMNKSGQAVSQISRFYKIKPENIWIVYDDMDLPLGKLKISFNKNSGGHKGVQSIIDQLGRKDFFRFRIGTDANSPPSADPPKAEKPQLKTQNYEQAKCKLENFVLGKFSNEEEKIIQEAIKKTALAIEAALKENIEKAMSKVN
jgi:PTH1 family peptidyl-tRNA hydrolase